MLIDDEESDVERHHRDSERDEQLLAAERGQPESICRALSRWSSERHEGPTLSGHRRLGRQSPGSWLADFEAERATAFEKGLAAADSALQSGGGGIRTHERLATPTVFEGRPRDGRSRWFMPITGYAPREAIDLAIRFLDLRVVEQVSAGV
jgi:hypothetical protein